jgi:hypothetical protein
MSQASFVGARRPPPVKVHPQRPAVPPARLTAPTTKSTRDHRARRLSAARVHAQSGSRIRETAPRLAFGIELVRAVLLLAGSVLAVLVALPVLLELAAAPFH